MLSAAEKPAQCIRGDTPHIPAGQTCLPALVRSRAISAPELPAPTTKFFELETAEDCSRRWSGQERLQKLAYATRQQWETGFEVTAIYHGAAAADSQAAAELSEALAGRQKSMEHFAKTWNPTCVRVWM